MQYSILHLCVLSKLADYSEGVRKFGLVWQLWLLRLQDTQIITFSRIRGTIVFFFYLLKPGCQCPIFLLTYYTCFQLKADRPWAHCYSCDLDPVTLIYEHELKILKTYLLPKMNFLGQGFEKLEHHRQLDTQTDATECIMTPHSRMVIRLQIVWWDNDSVWQRYAVFVHISV